MQSCLRAPVCFFLFVLTLALHTAPAQATRLALVIGNDAYQHIDRLRKAGGDAATMANELTAAGFTIVNGQAYRNNLNRSAVYEQLALLKSRIRQGDEVVVFFSGHGVQIGSASYLLPVDFRLGRWADGDGSRHCPATIHG